MPAGRRGSDEGWSDPLYRPRDELPAGVPRHTLAGVEVAISVTDTDPAELAAMWSDERTAVLTVVDGVTADELAAVVTEFLVHAGALVRSGTPGTAAATITLPSRDVERCAAVRAAGFAPSSVVAVAPMSRSEPRGDGPGGSTEPDGVRIRDAVAGDAEALAELWWEQARYETRIGSLRTTPAIRAAVDRAAAQRAAGHGTGLVAETSAGQLVGAVLADSVEDSRWVGGRVAFEAVSYLAMASTTAGARGRGVGALAVRELHRRHRAAGVAASLLHYSPNNPLSVPFWSRQGYRPLLTSFRHELG